MQPYAKYIDKFNIELASFSYSNINDLEINKLKDKGYLPLVFMGNGKEYDNSIAYYTQENAGILVNYMDKDLATSEYKDEISRALHKHFIMVNKEAKVYINGKWYNKNETPDLPEDLMKIFLEDKIKIEKKLKDTRQEKVNALEMEKTIEEIKAIDIITYPLYYFKVRSYDTLVKNMDKENTLDKFIGTDANIINVGNITINKTCVVYGRMGIKNLAYLKEKGIILLQRDYNSGTMVLNKGDFDFVINGEILNGEEVKMAIRDVLIELGANTTIDNNDLLINNKKFCGCIEPHKVEENDQFYRMHSHLSFDLDRELIEKVRVKEKTKEMIGIHEVLPDLTPKEFLRLWIEKFKSYGYIDITDR